MTLFLQYNVNNHTPDGVRFLWWSSVLPDSESVPLLNKGLLNLEPPLCSSGYAPAWLIPTIRTHTIIYHYYKTLVNYI